MPEIPEMELYKNNLNQAVKGKTISRVRVYRPKSINYEPEVFAERVQGVQIEHVERKGKYLIFDLSNNLKLLAHMMLDGRLYYLAGGQLQLSSSELEAGEFREKVPGLYGRPSVLFRFGDDSYLFFCQLTLGYLRLYDEEGIQPFLDELGPDPLSPEFSEEDFNQLLTKAGKRGRIKPWLMEQRNIAGIGNAYSNEALYRAGISPKRAIGEIAAEERNKLYRELREVLQESISRGGDMEEPFSPEDKFTGGFNPYFRAYDMANKPCYQCGQLIVREEVGGRNAFYCPHCQV